MTLDQVRTGPTRPAPRSEFGRSAPIVNYGPNSGPLGQAPGVRGVLWPALAYKVVAPVRNERPFNLFQEFVLKLARAGVVSAEDVGRRLALGTNLAAFVMLQLQGLGLLDRYGKPTDRAIRELDADDPADFDSVAGFVFQDPFTGNLWPRFMAGSLAYVRGQETWWDRDVSAVRAKYEIGPVGNPRTVRAVAVEPGRADLDRLAVPSAWSILSACRKHGLERVGYARTLRGRRAARVDDGPGRDDLSLADVPRMIDKVSLVCPSPQPVYLATYLFVPADVARASPWQVCDPFGLGPSARLRQALEGLTARDEGRALRAELAELTGRAYEVEAEDVADLARRRRRQAARTVAEQLGPAAADYPELSQRLADVEEAWAEAVATAAAGGAGYDIKQERARAILVAAYAAAEELFDAAHRQYPAADTLASLSTSAEDNARVLADLARRAGFTDEDADDPTFARFFQVGRGVLTGVSEFGRRDLPAQCAVLLAASNDLPEHPLHRLGRSFPGGVVFLARLKRDRDRAAHSSGQDVPRDRLDAARDGLYRWVRGLLPGMRAPSEGTGGGGGTDPGADGPAWGVELLHKLRARATAEVEARVGLGVRALRPLQQPLIELQVRAIELRLMSAGADAGRAGGPTASDGAGTVVKLKELTRAAGKAVEAALELLLAARPRRAGGRHDVTDDRRANAARFAAVAADLRFRMADGGSVPSALATVRPDRVGKALRTGRGTINALAAALLLSAEDEPDHPRRQVAGACPAFLLTVADVSDRRGHADRAGVRADEAAAVADRVLDLAAHVVAVLA